MPIMSVAESLKGKAILKLGIVCCGSEIGRSVWLMLLLVS